jgi:hypothetical protein
VSRGVSPALCRISSAFACTTIIVLLSTVYWPGRNARIVKIWEELPARGLRQSVRKLGYHAAALHQLGDAKPRHPVRLSGAVGATGISRYRGIAKNANHLFVTCALANLFIARHHLFRLQGA